MPEIKIPVTIYKKIQNFINNFPLHDHQKITIREINSSPLSVSYEIKITETHDDIPGFEKGSYVIFTDFENWK